jgi:hypothetical protein
MMQELALPAIPYELSLLISDIVKFFSIFLYSDIEVKPTITRTIPSGSRN